MAKREDYFRLRGGAHLGPVRFMAAAEGYVMARRPRALPFIMTVSEWNSLLECDKNGKPLPTPQGKGQ